MADTKRCGRCKLVKPKSEFNKNKRSKDGLACHCKLCVKHYNMLNNALKSERLKKQSAPHTKIRSNTEWNRLHRDAEKRRAQGEIVGNVTAKGIDSMPQVDSVLREMSELQFKIDHENKLCDDRIKMLKEYTEILIEPDLCHQFNLYIMLKEFLGKLCENGAEINRQFRFGAIRFSKGKLDTELRPKLANMAFDKP